ncbi:DedA family protein [Micromonospora ureilytica]|uniref:DedA family protein n=1 Tax=Micromonospora ureilytica TaxID=709868 RepID=UPI004039D0F6
MEVLNSLWAAVEHHPYAVIPLLVMAEGPAATVFAGSLVGTETASFWPILLVVVCADVTVDSLLYLFGRLGARPIFSRLLRRLGLSHERRGRLTAAVRRNLPMVVWNAKVADLAAVPSYLAAGLARVSFQRFLAWVAAFSVLRAALLIGLGVLVGGRAAELFASPGSALVMASALALTVMFVNLFVRHAVGRRHSEVES